MAHCVARVPRNALIRYTQVPTSINRIEQHDERDIPLQPTTTPQVPHGCNATVTPFSSVPNRVLSV